jgi:AcrR family transcriptional regulator
MAVADSPEARIRLLGQTAQAQSADPRERVLAEAFVLFYARGIRAVGVDLIISRAGVAKATFYRHFPSKLALVTAYVDRRQEAWLAWLRESVTSRAAQGTRGLLAIFDVLAELFADPAYRGCATCNAVAEVGHEAPEVLERARLHKADLQAYVADLAGDAGLAKAVRVAEQWVLLIDGAMVSAQRNGDAASARTAQRAAAVIISANGSRRVAKESNRPGR